jgi:hypothetical protein
MMREASRRPQGLPVDDEDSVAREGASLSLRAIDTTEMLEQVLL